jgi:NTE family protein
VTKIGLVLGAGGSVGLAYHGGVLAAVAEATGWDPRDAEIIVGTSAGSLTAAMLRAGISAADLTAISEGRRLSAEGAAIRERSVVHQPRVRARQFLSWRPLGDPRALLSTLTHPYAFHPAALMAALVPQGAASTEPFSGGLDLPLGGAWPERPLWVCSVRLRDGRRVVFGRPGDPEATVGRAVGASCAIPAYFEPVRIGGERYVDGGVASMLNLPVVENLGLDLIVLSAPMATASARPALRLDAGVRQWCRLQMAREVRRVEGAGTPVVALAPTRRMEEAMGMNPMEARRRHVVSREAFRSTLAQLRSDGGAARIIEALAPGQGRSLAPSARPDGLTRPLPRDGLLLSP